MYFEQAKDISNFEVLTEAATQADINIDEIRTFLSGDKYRSDVLTDDQTNKNEESIWSSLLYLYNTCN